MADFILSRRAVRKYSNSPLSEAEIEQLIAAFNAAPCALHHTEDMQATVVVNPELLNAIEDACDHSCYDAPLLFIITSNKDSQFGERNASAAAENIMIEANSLNLGSVYVLGAAMKLNNSPAIREALDLDENQVIQVIVPIGYPAEKSSEENRDDRYQVTIL